MNKIVLEKEKIEIVKKKNTGKGNLQGAEQKMFNKCQFQASHSLCRLFIAARSDVVRVR